MFFFGGGAGGDFVQVDQSEFSFILGSRSIAFTIHAARSIRPSGDPA